MEKSSKIIRYSFLFQNFSYIDVKATINASKTKKCKQIEYIDLDIWHSNFEYGQQMYLLHTFWVTFLIWPECSCPLTDMQSIKKTKLKQNVSDESEEKTAFMVVVDQICKIDIEDERGV